MQLAILKDLIQKLKRGLVSGEVSEFSINPFACHVILGKSPGFICDQELDAPQLLWDV